MTYNKNKGAGLAFIKANMAYEGDDCLKWPLHLDKRTGRGWASFNGRPIRAHRLMCIMVHGDPPTPAHEAAHECGNGHLACVNPRHIKWKTKSENRRDSDRHGTGVRSRYGSAGRLTLAQAEEIRALPWPNLDQKEVADRYGVSCSAITQVCKGITFTGNSKIDHWTSEEKAVLREMRAAGRTTREIASTLGRSRTSVSAKAFKIGATSNYVAPQASAPSAAERK